MSITVYGIRNCSTVRAACRWLAGREIGYRFHDVREDGLPASLLEAWAREVGSDRLLNRRSTSWRALAPEERDAAADTGAALSLIARHPTLLRRPVLETDTGILLGFDAGEYARRIGNG